VQVIQGEALAVLREMPDNSVDAIVSDPPAGVSFMSAKWDSDRGGRDTWIAWLAEIMAEARRVLKPGGHALVWSLPRTSHWTGYALENAGYEIRDTIEHLYGEGMPKSHNISRAIDLMEYRRREKAIKQALEEEGFSNVVWSTDHE
jgi:DNA modification methylase